MPGWHATIFPPYFVAGAIYAGFAMVLTLAIPLRKFYKLEDFITMKHLENMAKVMLATGLIVAYGYTMEAFFAWYSGNEYETYMIMNRMFGPYWWAYWALILCNVVAPNLLWIKNLRTSVPFLFGISFVVSIGMWLERFVIIVTSLHRDFLPELLGHVRRGRASTGPPSWAPSASSSPCSSSSCASCPPSPSVEMRTLHVKEEEQG